METERNHLRKTQLSQAKDLEKLRKQITNLKKQQVNQVSYICAPMLMHHFLDEN